MATLREKARAVFKGLDEKDYAIIRFFGEKGPKSKYEAKIYFEESPTFRIARATLYRRIKKLKEKQFLKVVRHEKFKRGKLEEDIEILSAETLKGVYAILGSGIDPIKIYEEPTEDVIFKTGKTIEKQIEAANVILDSLIELNLDLTDKVGSVPDMVHFLNTAVLTRRPEYINKLMRLHGVPNDPKRALQDFNEMVQSLQKDFEEHVGLFAPEVQGSFRKKARGKKFWKRKKVKG